MPTDGNPALTDLVTNHIVPISRFLALLLTGYFMLSLVINIGQAAMSGSLGNPRGRAHALEMTVASVLLYIIGMNADRIARLLLASIQDAADARQVIIALVVLLFQIVLGLVLMGAAVSGTLQIGILNISHNLGMGKGAADAALSILVTFIGAALVFALPYFGEIIFLAAVK